MQIPEYHDPLVSARSASKTFNLVSGVMLISPTPGSKVRQEHAAHFLVSSEEDEPSHADEGHPGDAPGEEPVEELKRIDESRAHDTITSSSRGQVVWNSSFIHLLITLPSLLYSGQGPGGSGGLSHYQDTIHTLSHAHTFTPRSNFEFPPSFIYQHAFRW